MKVLWFTWKDLKHPLSGGAEVVNEELAKRLIRDGNEVTLVVSGYKGCIKEETINGYKVIRLGNRYTVYWHAWRYYRKNFKGWADLVIDEINTVPFFAKFYAKEPNILFVHQLARQIWFYQSIFPINIVGYLAEPLYLWALRFSKVIVVSNSTKNDLVKFRFNRNNVAIIPEGISILPLKSIENIKKYSECTILSLGSMRKMKRTKDQIKAFELAKEKIPNLKMKIAGNAEGTYGQQALRMIKDSPYSSDIEYLGKVNEDQKISLMQKSHLIMVTSVKEGWGLIVTEAASQGTPALVYDVDGLRDSVQNNKTGLISISNTPKSLSYAMISLLSQKNTYDRIRKNAWEYSKQFTFDKSYKVFRSILKSSVN